MCVWTKVVFVLSRSTFHSKRYTYTACNIVYRTFFAWENILFDDKRWNSTPCCRCHRIIHTRIFACNSSSIPPSCRKTSSWSLSNGELTVPMKTPSWINTRTRGRPRPFNKLRVRWEKYVNYIVIFTIFFYRKTGTIQGSG